MVVTPFCVRDTVVIFLPLAITVDDAKEVKVIGNEKLKLNAAAAGTAPCSGAEVVAPCIMASYAV